MNCIQEHAISHACEDIRQLGPTPLTATDLFESNHSHFKQIRRVKRTSKNVLYTLITNHEKVSVYNSTSEMFPSAIERTIKKIAKEKLVQDFLKSNKVSGKVLYECSKLSVYGTEYKRNTYIVLVRFISSSSILFPFQSSEFGFSSISYRLAPVGLTDD